MEIPRIDDNMDGKGNAIALKALRYYQDSTKHDKTEPEHALAIMVALSSPRPLKEAITREALTEYEEMLQSHLDSIRDWMDSKKDIEQWSSECYLIDNLFHQHLIYPTKKEM